VHETAERGFQQGAGAYERGRPSYPPEALEWLAAEARLHPGRVVVDVGAGTGKLTRALLSSGAELLAVEPVAAMRTVLERAAPGARVLAGSAEELPLAAASVDAIVVAQAFHWFDGPRALDEFHRVLRPDGRLALIWNRRRSEQSLWRSVEAIIGPHRGDTPTYDSGAWRNALERSELFAPAGEFGIAWEQASEVEQFVDRVLSMSFVAALPAGEREQLAGRLRQAVAGEARPLSLGYVCEIFLFEPLVGGASTSAPGGAG